MVEGGQCTTEQATKLWNSFHVVVSTPGRINDCMGMAYQRSYVVLDEAVRMINLRFAPQIEDTLESEDETEAKLQERDHLERLEKAVTSHRITAMFIATISS